MSAKSSTAPALARAPSANLPLPQYLGSLTILTCLLVGSFITLPRSTKWLSKYISTTPSVRTSLDRPEHPFLMQYTADPILTMLADIVSMVTCMMWWTPYLRAWWGAAAQKPAAGEKEDLPTRLRTSAARLAETAVAVLIVSLVLVPGLMLFGAPLDSHFVQTYLLSLHLSILLVWPPIYALGVPSIHPSGSFARFRLKRLLSEWRVETPLDRTLIHPFLGTLAGALIGVAAYPLDWDRPWQTYPLPTVASSVIGYVIGGFVSFATSALESAAEEQAGESQAVKVSTPGSSKKKNKRSKA